MQKQIGPGTNSQLLAPLPAVLLARQEQPGYVHFGDAAGLLWRRKRTLLAFAAAGLLLGILLVLTERRTYQAKTTVEVQMPNEDYLNRRQLNPVVEPGIILLEPFLQTQLRLMQTDTILLRVVAKLNARKHPELNPPPGWLARLRQRIFPKAEKPVSDASILEVVRDRLTARTAGSTQIIELLFESSDPAFAASFLNALAEEYRSESRKHIVDTAAQTADLLSAQIDELKKSVDDAEAKLAAFVGANSLLVPTDKESLAEAQLRQTQTALGVAHDARVAEQSRYETVRAAAPESIAKLLDSDALRAYRLRLTELRQKLAEAVELYKPAHYTVRQIEAEIREVESSFERERAGILARLRSQYVSEQMREDALRADYELQAGQVASQMGKSIRYTTLKRDLDTRRQLYETMQQRVKEASLISAMEASNVRVLDPATPPERPIKPNKLLYTAIGLTSGIVNGLIYLLVTQGRAPVRPGTEVLEISQLPHLASIPKLDADAAGSPEVLPPLPEQELIMQRPGAPGVPLAADADLELSAVRRADSAGARAFQYLVKRIFFSSPRAKRPRVVMITSSCHGEGRTTVACNLGASLARTGLMVLLVDADRINPRLHDVFGIPNTPGFTDLIASHMDGAPSAASESAWMTEVAGLFVLPGGRAMGRLATLIDDPRTTAVLDGCCRDFDVVIVDAPPVLSPGDARGLSLHSDAVVLVVRNGCATQELVAAAERQLAADGARVAGKVINCYEAPDRKEA